MPPASDVRASASPALSVVPDVGRPNDTFYLAGGRFPPNEQVSVTMFCNSWYMDFYGNWRWTVSTDAHGNFAGVKLGVPTPQLVDVRKRSTSCMIYGSSGGNWFAAAVPFGILPTEAPPPAHSFSIRVVMSVKRVGSRDQERLTARSAPGAKLHCTFDYGRGRTNSYFLRVPWTGVVKARWPVPARVDSPSRASLRVTGTLGDLQGRAEEAFRL